MRVVEEYRGLAHFNAYQDLHLLPRVQNHFTHFLQFPEMGIIPRRNTVCRTPPTCHNTCTDPVACWADPRGRWSCGHQYHRESSTWPAPPWSSTAGPGGSDTCPLPGINSVSYWRISLCGSPTLVCSRDADVGIKATLPSLSLTMQIFSRES